MSDSDKKFKDLDYLEENVIEDFRKEIEFEEAFYSAIAGSMSFEVIPIPCNNGSFLSEDDKEAIAAYAKKSEKILLFRVSHGDIALIFGEQGEKLGVVPEFNAHGFPC